MAQGYPTTDDEKIRIIELVEKGLSQQKVSEIIGCSQSTVSRVYHDFYGKDVRSMDVIIAGDKKHGTLTCTGPDHYVGTCAVSGGKMKKRHFNIKGSENAKKAFEEWRASLQPKPVNTIDKPKKETTMTTVTTANTTNTVVKHIYILAVGEPKLAGWFVDEDKARQAMEVANKALQLAGYDALYSVVEAGRQN